MRYSSFFHVRIITHLFITKNRNNLYSTSILKQKRMYQVGRKISCLFVLFLNLYSLQATIFYSRQDGSWSTSSTWSEEADGSPAAASSPSSSDTVVISHDVSLTLSAHYTHTGNITILAAGILDVSRSGSARRFIFAGAEMHVWGEFSTDSDMFVGREWTSDTPIFVVYEDGNIEIGDDFILCGNSATSVHVSNCSTASTIDDIYFYGSSAYMCGGGHFIVPDKLRIWDDDRSELSGSSATSAIESQLCDGFRIFQSTGNCSVDRPRIVGTGAFTLAAAPLSVALSGPKPRMELSWQFESHQPVSQWEIWGWDQSGGRETLLKIIPGPKRAARLHIPRHIEQLQVVGHVPNNQFLRSNILSIPGIPNPKPSLTWDGAALSITHARPNHSYEVVGIDMNGREMWRKRCRTGNLGKGQISLPPGRVDYVRLISPHSHLVIPLFSTVVSQ